ncbi:hypothetical protein F511_14733 [Dorcoceras hygrometricum]|uniref:Disease resistance protein winged helix domain-containing protein n=1 Tax=Dorcoceras hygrometricum TaxID=472368 RepID=A0A2Z7AVD3_9LAMI|nr:hypothetical protein F511_14733 [Dorcoceras hygrometricum]
MEPTIALQCSKILCLSYDNLPLRLKPCFLYIAAFPEDLEINVSKLINLWVAEGFVTPNDQSKCLEDAAEGYLEDLVHRSLILVNKIGMDGKIETVGIHDLLREICITKAEEEGFLHVSSKKGNPIRRISIHCMHDYDQQWPIEDPRVRSVLLFPKKDLVSIISQSCRSLSILEASQVTFLNFADVISTFVNLRYICFALNDASCPLGFPASIFKLPNLQTIIVHISPSLECREVDGEIWKMPKLRHLIMDCPLSLSHPFDMGIVSASNLQTLDEVMNLRFTDEAVKMFVNLKKLRVVSTMFRDNWDDFNLDNLVRLENLRELRVCVHKLTNLSGLWDHCFPISLNKLSLFGVPLPWKNMSIIGSLPNLQELQMMSVDVAEASEWTPVEGQFLQLKYFHSSFDNLVKWEVEKEHFPSLERLILESVWCLDEIPCEIGKMDSLQIIELWECHSSLAVSAQLIQKDQHENGNDTFQVLVK